MGKLSLSFFLLVALALQSDTCNAAAPRKAVGFYELKKGNFSVKVTNWGATIASVILPDSKGSTRLFLPFPSLQQTESNNNNHLQEIWPMWFSATIDSVPTS